MTPKERLIEALQQRRGDRTIVALASDIDVVQSNLGRFLAGQQELGIDLARKIAARYPELRDLVSATLLGEQFREPAATEAIA